MSQFSSFCILLLYLSGSAALDEKEKLAQNQDKIGEVRRATAGLDADELCCYWAYKGHCDSNPRYMRVNCQRSCGTFGCTASKVLECEVKLISLCGGSHNPHSVVKNDPETARKFWDDLDNLEKAYQNPQKFTSLEINESSKQKRAASRFRRADQLTEGYVNILPDQYPFDSVLGSLVSQNGAGYSSYCSGSLVNIGTESNPIVVVLTAAHCVLDTQPIDCYDNPNTCDHDCEQLNDAECTNSRHSNFQFRTNFRRAEGEDGSIVDVTAVNTQKGECYALCDDTKYGGSKAMDPANDYALLEIENYSQQDSLPLNSTFPDFAINVGYPQQNCDVGWTEENPEKLPDGYDPSNPDWCWGNSDKQLPLTIDGSTRTSSYLGSPYNVHTQDPFGDGDSGGAWLSPDSGSVVALTSFSSRGAGEVWSPVFYSDEFQQLKDSIVEQYQDQETDGRTEEGEDSEASCCQWAKEGRCDEYPFWMRPNCGKSCGTPKCTVNYALACKVRVNSEDCS